MIEFEFKKTNQEVTLYYRPPARRYHLGGSTQLSSNTGATAHSEQTVALPPAHRATSARTSGSTPVTPQNFKIWNITKID
jgi:hypothetical protein